MPLYDYKCSGCGDESERQALIENRRDQQCDACGFMLEIIYRPAGHYKPFNNYFDIGLGVEITGRDHRRRVMRDLSMDFRDHPSKGDASSRLDKIADKKREQARMR